MLKTGLLEKDGPVPIQWTGSPAPTLIYVKAPLTEGALVPPHEEARPGIVRHGPTQGASHDKSESSWRGHYCGIRAVQLCCTGSDGSLQ
ncbi:hypothetical protein BSR47_02805, partial [Bradyrhizobium canariense]